MAKSIRAPSIELLRLLRHPPVLPRCPGFKRTCTRTPNPNLTRASCYSTGATRAAHPPTQASGHAPSSARRNPYAPATHDRGPASEEDTQTDFGAMDIFNGTPEAATSIDACTPGGFHLNNGAKITGGSGVLLAGGEAWAWKPWMGGGQSEARISDLLDARGVLVLPLLSLSLLKFLHPKPDLLLVGTGSKTLMLHPESRRYIVEQLGMRVDVMDTANASAAYNLLAKERGVEGGGGVGGAMLPVGWKGEVKKR